MILLSPLSGFCSLLTSVIPLCLHSPSSSLTTQHFSWAPLPTGPLNVCVHYDFVHYLHFSVFFSLYMLFLCDHIQSHVSIIHQQLPNPFSSTTTSSLYLTSYQIFLPGKPAKSCSNENTFSPKLCLSCFPTLIVSTPLHSLTKDGNLHSSLSFITHIQSATKSCKL